MRSRDIKTRLDTAYMAEGRGTPEQQAEARAEHAQLRILARIRKKQARQQIRALANPDNPPPPFGGRLKPGPKPNPFLDKCNHGLHTQLRGREYKAFEALWKRQAPPGVTRSSFLRFLICEKLESERRKDCPSMPFSVDLHNLPKEARRGRHAARRAA